MIDILTELSKLIGKEHGRSQLVLNYLLRNDYLAAFKECEAVLRADPDFMAAHLLKAIIYIKESRYQQAIDCCMRVAGDAGTLINADSQSVEKACLLMAHCYRELGNRPHALLWIKHNLALAPHNPLPNYFYGELLLEEQQWTAAIQSFQVALQYNPQLVMAHHKIAHAYQQLGKEHSAKQHAEAALQLIPSFAAAMSLGNFFLANHQLSKALHEFRNAMALNPRIPECHRMVGEICLQLGDLEAAELAFRTALLIFPKMFDAMSGLGHLCLRKHLYAAATGHFIAALNIHPYLKSAQMGINEIYFHFGSDKLAYDALNNLLSRIGKKNAAAETLADSGEFKAAITIYRDELALAHQPALPVNRNKTIQAESNRELRRKKRIAFNFDLLALDAQGNQFDATILDISNLGILIECNKQLKADEIIQFGLKFDTYQKHINRRGRVVRQIMAKSDQMDPAEEYRYGIEFIASDAEGDRYWSDWLDI